MFYLWNEYEQRQLNILHEKRATNFHFFRKCAPFSIGKVLLYVHFINGNWIECDPHKITLYTKINLICNTRWVENGKHMSTPLVKAQFIPAFFLTICAIYQLESKIVTLLRAILDVFPSFWLFLCQCEWFWMFVHYFKCAHKQNLVVYMSTATQIAWKIHKTNHYTVSVFSLNSKIRRMEFCVTFSWLFWIFCGL